MTAATTLVPPLVAPILVAVVAAVRGWSRSVAWATVGSALVIFLAGVAAGIGATRGNDPAVGQLLRADSLSAVMMLVIGAVALVATWASRYSVAAELEADETDLAGARRYATLVPLFLSAMVLAVLAANLGVLWAAIAATTVVTAFLVGHRRTTTSLEATWKYVVICSVGIAIAYLGTVLAYFAGTSAGLSGTAALDWVSLSAHAASLDPGVMRLAFALLVVGFGTKAGLVPLHSWLPDAHSQAPAPVSALMSGVLLSVGVYAVLRYRTIVEPVLSPTFVRTVLLSIALTSLALAAWLLVSQRDYKRMLAYSSIEHMALCTVGVAVGTRLAVAAVLLHVVGHGLAKAVLFCTSGRILAATGTSRIAGVRGLLSSHRALAAVFAVGLVALLGLPPFSLFASEVALVRATVEAGLGWVAAAVLVLVVLAFVAILVKVTPMLLGGRDDSTPAVATGDVPASVGRTDVPMLAALGALVVLGLVSWPLGTLLDSAAQVVIAR
ncbi:MAG TPA: proton-conducting transporter membrane subunit [Actinomycetales bacterium]|nr:proton-conducting transporter membrane subunit [Actinomycetales bacterium]